MANQLPQIAIIGAGIFVKTQYIPRLAEISNLFVLKYIWSRSEESARGAVEVAKNHFPSVECKWGDRGLDEIIQDESVLGVAVVLAGQTQVDMSLKLLKAGKHVLQETSGFLLMRKRVITYVRKKLNSSPLCCREKSPDQNILISSPVQSISEIETALSSYKSICANSPGNPIWAVAENYRFEPAFVECKKLMADIGKMMSIQLIIEGSMNSKNPYFSSSWRRNFTGGFILDMGVHFIAGLRMLVGCEVTSVSAMTSHVDTTLPPPDNISSVFHLENGCSGVLVMVVSSRSPKILWRIVGLKGTMEVGRGNEDGQHGYTISFYGADGQCKTTFYPFSGVTDELKAFFHDISQANLKKGSGYEVEPRLSFIEGARDVAVLDAMLESGNKNGALVQVKKF